MNPWRPKPPSLARRRVRKTKLAYGRVLAAWPKPAAAVTTPSASSNSAIPECARIGGYTDACVAVCRVRCSACSAARRRHGTGRREARRVSREGGRLGRLPYGSEKGCNPLHGGARAEDAVRRVLRSEHHAAS